MNLTTHFSLEELTHSDTAVDKKIDNSPPPDVVAHLAITAEGMERVRDVLGGKAIRVNSGFRCEALERIVAGKGYETWLNQHKLAETEANWKTYFSTKAHPHGFAVDFVCPGFGMPAAIVKALHDSGIKFDQCIEEGTWVHISFDPRMRQMSLAATFDKDGKPSYKAA